MSFWPYFNRFLGCVVCIEAAVPWCACHLDRKRETSIALQGLLLAGCQQRVVAVAMKTAIKAGAAGYDR